MNDFYINVGSEKCCLFVKMSIFLMKGMEKNPKLYYAVEDALESAKNERYSIGIMAFSQLLNMLNKETPESRHVVAHKMLRQRPSKQMYEEAKEAFERATAERSDHECRQHGNIIEFREKILKEWEAFITKLHQTYMAKNGKQRKKTDESKAGS